jgi:uncharacterized BrkB/YihY/UPF0761 family membrane protein
MKTKDILQTILAILIIIGFFLLLTLLLYTKVPNENKDLLNLVVGALIGSFATVVGYFFGSSSSSAKKDDTISTLASPK